MDCTKITTWSHKKLLQVLRTRGSIKENRIFNVFNRPEWILNNNHQSHRSNNIYTYFYPLIVQPLAPYMVLVHHIFMTLQYTFKTLQELFRHNKYVILIFY